ncbi:MAG: DUF1579 domain-containing protein [Fimbriiglobus sp.]
MKRFFGFCVALILTTTTFGQEPPKPGPEHEVLKKMIGTWDCTMKFAGAESKATANIKLGLGGLWVISNFEGEFGGEKFSGMGMDTYDPATKKYVGVWCDSMSTNPMKLTGSYDKEKKAMTMVGEAPGPDGKPTTHRMVSTWKDDDKFIFEMYMGDAKESTMTITYKRKK